MRTLYIVYSLLVILVVDTAMAQYIVEPCSNYNYSDLLVDHDGDYDTGVEGREFDILTIYKNSGSAVPDCWVLKSPNNLDHVIIPGNWTSNPNASQQEIINATFEALIKARGQYSVYGEMRKKWYFLLEGRAPDQDGQAYTTDLGCWMRAVSWRESNGLDGHKQMVAHEAGHCFTIENLEDPRYHYYKQWLDESFAEYMSTLVYPEVNLEHRFAKVFDLDETAFTQPYRAYALLEYYANAKASVEEVINLVKVLYKVPWNEDKYYLNRIGFAQYLHDFYFRHYQKELFDPGGGNVPREPIVKLRSPSITFQPDGDPIELNAVTPDMLSVFELVIPAGYDLEIQIPQERGLEGNYSIIGIMDDIANWSETQNIQGNCEKETPIKLLVSHMNNRPLTGVTIPYDLSERTGCCGSSITVEANPSDDVLEGRYTFDYYIESDIETIAEGQFETIHMNYYVNSKDGSILLEDGFFMDNIGTMESGGMEAEAVIWRSNGQPVGFVIDHDQGQRRAITIDVNQTSADVMGPRAVNPRELLREGKRSGLPLMELPWDSPWLGKAEGYVYNRAERNNPQETLLMTAYVSHGTTSVNSPMASFGFMVGHIKDLAGKNKQLVFTRFDSDEADFIEARLKRLERRCAEFNASGYKKMTIGSSTGALAAMTEAQRNQFGEDYLAQQAHIEELVQQMEQCRGNQACLQRIMQEMEKLEKSLKTMYDDLPENPYASGNDASNLRMEEEYIEEQIYTKQNEIFETESRCDRLSRIGSTIFAERCERELEQRKQELRQLQCELARLRGMGDLLEDCD